MVDLECRATSRRCRDGDAIGEGGVAGCAEPRATHAVCAARARGVNPLTPPMPPAPQMRAAASGEASGVSYVQASLRAVSASNCGSLPVPGSASPTTWTPRRAGATSCAGGTTGIRLGVRPIEKPVNRPALQRQRSGKCKSADALPRSPSPPQSSRTKEPQKHAGCTSEDPKGTAPGVRRQPVRPVSNSPSARALTNGAWTPRGPASPRSSLTPRAPKAAVHAKTRTERSPSPVGSPYASPQRSPARSRPGSPPRSPSPPTRSIATVAIKKTSIAPNAARQRAASPPHPGLGHLARFGMSTPVQCSGPSTPRQLARFGTSTPQQCSSASMPRHVSDGASLSTTASGASVATTRSKPSVAAGARSTPDLSNAARRQLASSSSADCPSGTTTRVSKRNGPFSLEVPIRPGPVARPGASSALERSVRTPPHSYTPPVVTPRAHYIASLPPPMPRSPPRSAAGPSSALASPAVSVEATPFAESNVRGTSNVAAAQELQEMKDKVRLLTVGLQILQGKLEACGAAAAQESTPSNLFLPEDATWLTEKLGLETARALLSGKDANKGVGLPDAAVAADVSASPDSTMAVVEPISSSACGAAVVKRNCADGIVQSSSNDQSQKAEARASSDDAIGTFCPSASNSTYAANRMEGQQLPEGSSDVAPKTIAAAASTWLFEATGGFSPASSSSALPFAESDNAATANEGSPQQQSRRDGYRSHISIPRPVSYARSNAEDYLSEKVHYEGHASGAIGYPVGCDADEAAGLDKRQSPRSCYNSGGDEACEAASHSLAWAARDTATAGASNEVEKACTRSEAGDTMLDSPFLSSLATSPLLCPSSTHSDRRLAIMSPAEPSRSVQLGQGVAFQKWCEAFTGARMGSNTSTTTASSNSACRLSSDSAWCERGAIPEHEVAWPCGDDISVPVDAYSSFPLVPTSSPASPQWKKRACWNSYDDVLRSEWAPLVCHHYRLMREQDFPVDGPTSLRAMSADVAPDSLKVIHWAENLGCETVVVQAAVLWMTVMDDGSFVVGEDVTQCILKRARDALPSLQEHNFSSSEDGLLCETDGGRTTPRRHCQSPPKPDPCLEPPAWTIVELHQLSTTALRESTNVAAEAGQSLFLAAFQSILAKPSVH